MLTKERNTLLLDLLLQDQDVPDTPEFSELRHHVIRGMTEIEAKPKYLYPWSTVPLCTGALLYRLPVRSEQIDGKTAVRLLKAAENGFQPKQPILLRLSEPDTAERLIRKVDARNTGLVSYDFDCHLTDCKIPFTAESTVEVLLLTNGKLTSFGHTRLYIDSLEKERDVLADVTISLDRILTPKCSATEWLESFLPKENL